MMNWIKHFLTCVIDFLWHLPWHLLDIYHELKPCRFSFLVAALGAIVFLWVDQGTEVLRALGEPSGVRGVTVTSAMRLTCFWTGLAAWSLASWYTSRILLYLDFPDTHVQRTERSQGWQSFHNWLQRQTPRVLGIVPLLVVGGSFLWAQKSYEDTSPPTLFWFGLSAIVAGVVLYVLFWLRRHWLDLGTRQETETEEGRTVTQLRGESRIAIALMALISAALTLMFVISPVFFAGALGTGAVLMFAAASWVFWGSAIVYLAGRSRLPLLTFLAAWLAFCSLHNDNHDVRTLSREKPFAQTNVETALLKWHDQIVRKYPDRPVHPLFIVTAEGGGIRAAYWTASVLGSIQDENKSFADHIFAISGVSGGSVGAAVFDGLLSEATPQREFPKTGILELDQHPFTGRAQRILGSDFLSPAIAAMLYPDFIQRFWPWPYPFLDRGRWLERSWEKAWRETTGNDRFAGSFFDLWKNSEPYVPALLLNGTSVENGNRLIISNLLIENKEKEEFLGAEEVTKKIAPALDLPLSTAAHISARFTYVSPAGRFSSSGTHVVDGGYFENSGATTALDTLRQVIAVLKKSEKSDGKLGDIVPKIIMISNSPVGTAFGDRKPEEQPRDCPTTSADAEHNKPGTFLEDALAPAYALLSTRDARGVYAQRAIGKAQEVLYNEVPSLVARGDDKQVYLFSLAPAKVPLPLGWMLSNKAALAMQQELYDRYEDGVSKCSGPPGNTTTRDQILASLPRP
jgi:hypothetical protein